MQQADVIIVGAGAAGLATAIFAARANPALRIVALDGARQIGAKILVSGGGRCNVTNARVTPADFYGGNPNILRRTFAAFDEHATRAFFAEIGVPLHEEAYGKLFPDSNSARTVVAALLREAERRGVKLRTAHRVTGISREAAGFALRVAAPTGEEQWRCERLVLATGGLSLPRTGSDGAGYAFAQALGHTLVATTPALDPLRLDGAFHADLAGVAHDMRLTLRRDGQKPVHVQGPALWTHFGLSGPAALNLSRHWLRARLEGAAAELSASFVGASDFGAVEQVLIELGRTQPRVYAASALHRWVPLRVAEALARSAGVNGQLALGRLGRNERRRLVHALTAWRLPVVGTRGYKFAEVTAGGVPLNEIDPRAMASRCCPGLHLVGEMLDVDGRIGGFNFQWAWSSGYVAGAALARDAMTKAERQTRRPEQGPPRGGQQGDAR